jgi:hypothetical protein
MKTLSQKETLLAVLREKGSVNSYDADYVLHIKQAPTRIHELKKDGYLITSRTKADKSVDWILLDEPKPVVEQEESYNYHYVFNGDVGFSHPGREETCLRCHPQPVQRRLIA